MLKKSLISLIDVTKVMLVRKPNNKMIRLCF